MDVFTVAAWVVVVAFGVGFLVTVLLLLGLFSEARDQHLGKLVAAFLIELAAAFFYLARIGPPEVEVWGDPPPQAAYALDATGNPVKLAIFSGGDTALQYPPIDQRRFRGVPRVLKREGERLLVTSAGGVDGRGVFLGYLADPSDRIVELSVSPELALAIGRHFAEWVDGERREPKAACRFLGITVKRGRAAEAEEKKMAARTLFHIRESCQAIGEEGLVIQAIADHRPEPYRSKELGDAFLSFAVGNQSEATRYRIRGLAHYLAFLARMNTGRTAASEPLELHREEVRRAIPGIHSRLWDHQSLRSPLSLIRTALERGDAVAMESWSARLLDTAKEWQ